MWGKNHFQFGVLSLTVGAMEFISSQAEASRSNKASAPYESDSEVATPIALARRLGHLGT